MEWFTLALKHYADFEGRNHRTAYWMFVLFYLIFYFVASAIDGLLVMIYFLVQDSQPGDNQYGPNPKPESGTTAT